MTPKISVCIVTYNQVKYIGQCLESVFEQKTNFEFEVVIGDDASNDGTREVIRSFQEKYPDKLRTIFHENNIGPAANVYATYQAAKGEYIAHLDGDDYMLPGKLQIQCNILDSDPSLSMCTHDLIQIDNLSNIIKKSFKKISTGEKTLSDLYETLPFFGHSSKMFRSIHKGKLASYPRPDLIDIEIHVSQAKNGGIYHIDQALGAYRVNVGITGNRSTINPLLPAATDRIFAEAFSEKTIPKHLLDCWHARSHINYAYQSAVIMDSAGFKYHIKKSISIAWVSPIQLLMSFFLFMPKIAIKLCMLRARTRTG